MSARHSDSLSKLVRQAPHVKATSQPHTFFFSFEEGRRTTRRRRMTHDARRNINNNDNHHQLYPCTNNNNNNNLCRRRLLTLQRYLYRSYTINTTLPEPLLSPFHSTCRARTIATRRPKHLRMYRRKQIQSTLIPQPLVCLLVGR